MHEETLLLSEVRSVLPVIPAVIPVIPLRLSAKSGLHIVSLRHFTLLAAFAFSYSPKAAVVASSHNRRLAIRAVHQLRSK